MAFYELVFIVRQDISSTDVDKITEEYKNLIENNKGKIIKSEYWGLRNLAYEIKKNKKGHYVWLGVETTSDIIKEFERKVKLNENIIRYITLNVEKIRTEPSPIFKSRSVESENIVDVTSA